ncbi:hypothetical protein VCHA29O37_460031 [Vibrio chagasii]|nr:hypothetical protein VCHA29O37_460031 [Vibrio chagasii]
MLSLKWTVSGLKSFAVKRQEHILTLSELKHGERFQVVRTGECGLLIGLFGDKRNRVVVLDNHPRLTNFNIQTQVNRL